MLILGIVLSYLAVAIFVGAPLAKYFESGHATTADIGVYGFLWGVVVPVLLIVGAVIFLGKISKALWFYEPKR